MDYGILKGKDFTLTAYIDANWAGSIDDRKSTSGQAFFFGKCFVSWLRKKKTTISLSTTKVEYIVVASYYTQVIWVKKTLEDIWINYDRPILINHDNYSAINISKKPVMHSKTKHIPIKYHFLREQVS